MCIEISSSFPINKTRKYNEDISTKTTVFQTLIQYPANELGLSETMVTSYDVFNNTSLSTEPDIRRSQPLFSVI